jgi:hypothetical protein
MKGGGWAWPISSAHVRWCEHGAPARSSGDRVRIEGKSCGIPHLAKNERDVGHPALVEGRSPKGAWSESTIKENLFP